MSKARAVLLFATSTPHPRPISVASASGARATSVSSPAFANRPPAGRQRPSSALPKAIRRAPEDWQLRDFAPGCRRHSPPPDVMAFAPSPAAIGQSPSRPTVGDHGRSRRPRIMAWMKRGRFYARSISGRPGCRYGLSSRNEAISRGFACPGSPDHGAFITLSCRSRSRSADLLRAGTSHALTSMWRGRPRASSSR